MKMTIDAEVCTFAKPRSSSGSIRYFRDPVTVEIPEVSASDAPVAMSWVSKQHGPLETRWIDGSHWFVFDRHFQGNRQARFTASDVARLVASVEDRSMNDLFSGYFSKADANAPYIDRGKFVEFGDHDRENTHAQVRTWASDTLVVDGILFTRCPEPRYRASIGGLEVIVERSVNGKASRRFDRMFNPFHATEIFRADRYEEAWSATTAVGGNLIAEERIEVFMNESIMVNDDWEALVDTCMDSLNAFGREPLTSLPPSVIGALAPLSACFWEKDRADIDGDDAYNALSGFAHAVSSSGYKLARVNVAAERTIQSALNRWDDRPIELAPVSEHKGPRP